MRMIFVYLYENHNNLVNLSTTQNKIFHHKKVNRIVLRQPIARNNYDAMDEKRQILNDENQKRRPNLSAEYVMQSFVRPAS